MINENQQLYLNKSLTYWKNIKLAFTKQSKLSVEDILTKSDEIKNITDYLIINQSDARILVTFITDVFIPISNNILNHRNFQNKNTLQKQFENTLDSFIKFGIFLFKKYKILKSLDLIFIITNCSKSFYQQNTNHQSNHIQADQTQIFANNNQTIALPDAISVQFDSTYMDIKQTNDLEQKINKKMIDDNNYLQMDRKLISKYSQNEFKVIKRVQYKEFYNHIAQNILVQLSLQEIFQDNNSEIFTKYFQIVCSLNKVIYTQYLKKIVNIIKYKILASLLSCQQKYIRNLTESIYCRIYDCAEILWRRLKFQNHQYIWFENFKLNYCIPLIRSKILKQRIYGLKLLTQFTKSIDEKRNLFINCNEHLNWLIQYKIVEEIYNLESHQKILQLGAYLFNFLCKYNKIDNKLINNIIILLQKVDKTTKKSLIKMLMDSLDFLCLIDKQTILLGVIQLNQQHLNQQLIDLLFIIGSQDKIQLYTKTNQYLWKSVQNYKENQFKIKQRLYSAIILMIELGISKNFITTLIPYFEKLYQLLQIKKLVSIELLKKIFKLIEVKSKQEIHQKYEKQFIQYLIIHKNICNDLLKAANDELNTQKFKQVSFDLLHIFLQKYQQSKFNKQLTYEILIKSGQYPKIFNQLLNDYQKESEQLFYRFCNLGLQNIQNFNCLRELFYKVNKETIVITVLDNFEKIFQVKSIPKNLKGYKQLQNLLISNEKQIVKDHIAIFIASLYFHLDIQLKQSQNIIIQAVLLQIIHHIIHSNHTNTIHGYLLFLEKILNQTQKRGTGQLNPHESLVNTNIIQLNIQIHKVLEEEGKKYFHQKLPSNKLLIDLLNEMANQYNFTIENIIVKNNQLQINQNQFGLTIEQLNLNHSSLVIYCNYNNIPKKSFLLEDGKLSPKAVSIFNQIFRTYSYFGKIDKPTYAKYIQISTNSHCSVNDQRVTYIFTKFDKQRSGYLKHSTFLAAAEQYCKLKQTETLANLFNLGYSEQILKYNQKNQVKIVYNPIVRQILSEKQDFYEVLFKLSNDSNQTIRQKSKRLLKRLPTFIKYLENIFINFNLSHQNQFVNEYNTIIVLWLLTLDHTKYNTNKYYGNFINQNQQKIKDFKQNFALNNSYIEQIQIKLNQIIMVGLKSMNKTQTNQLILILDILQVIYKLPKFNQLIVQTELSIIPQSILTLPKLLFPQIYSNMNITIFAGSISFLMYESKLALESLIFPGLFNEQKQIRKISRNFLYLYKRLHSKININLFELNVEYNCDQYFELLLKIIQEQQFLDHQTILCQIFKLLQNYTPKEQQTKKFDQFLNGKLKIISLIITLSPQLIQILNQNTIILLKILHLTLFNQNRQILYSLLVKLKDLPTIQYFTNFIKYIQPNRINTFKSNFVGLQNLGCICYMNSMMQQFYMTKQFRFPLLSLQQQKQSKIVSKNNRQYRDNILYQMQKMFSHLMMSERNEYNPEDFCYSFRSDINLKIQQDAQQFLNIIFEKIQKQMRSTPYPNLLNNVFGGQTVVTIKCLSCNKQKHKIEDFNNISIEVRDRKNIYDSFAKFIQKEMISDFYCQFCETKVAETVKQTNLYSLPNILIIHLQRIIYDLIVQDRVKIHSRLQFPTELNLFQYLKRIKNSKMYNESDSIYILKGVVIHSGNAQSGHYFSLIKQRNEWYKFDDSRVSKFNFSEMGNESFGKNESQNKKMDKYSSSKNAYMLVYQKKNKSENEIKNVSAQNIEIIKKMADIQCKQKENQENISLFDIKIKKYKQYIRQDIKNEILIDNNKLFHEMQFYNSNFFEFIQKFVNKLDLPFQNLNQFITQYSLDYYPQFSQLQINKYYQRSKFLFQLVQLISKLDKINKKVVQNILTYITLTFIAVPDLPKKYLLSINSKQLILLINEHKDPCIRNFYRLILNICIKIMIKFYNIQYNQQQGSDISNCIRDLLNNCKSILKSNQIFKSFEFYQFWYYFCKSHVKNLEYCLKQDITHSFINVLFNTNSRSASLKTKPINNNIESDSCHIVIYILSILIEYSKIKKIQLNSLFYIDETKNLRSFQLYTNLISKNIDKMVVINLILALCKNDHHFSREFALNFILKRINDTQIEQQILQFCFKVIYFFVKLKDQFSEERLSWIFGVPQYSSPDGSNFCLNNTLNNQVIVYLSSLNLQNKKNKSFLQVLYQNRKNKTIGIVVGVVGLLELLKDKRIINYIIRLPPPNYLYAQFIDWIHEFFLKLKDQINLYIQINTKDAKKWLNNLSIIKDKMQQLRQTKIIHQDQEQISQMNIQLEPERCILDYSECKIQSPFQILLAKNLQSFIIGKNFFQQQSDPIQYYIEGIQINIRPMIYYTYVIQSKPTGDDNLSLKKKLFQDRSNLNKFPLKYFVYDNKNEEQLKEQTDGQKPQIRPSIIQLLISCDGEFKMTINSQKFQFQLFFTTGKTKINIPYIEQFKQKIKIEIAHKIEQKNQKKIIQNHIQHQYKLIPSQYTQFEQVNQISCPVCTYININSKNCEMCTAELY